MSKAYTCGFCHEERDDFCGPCSESFPSRPPVNMDDIDARVAEMYELLMTPQSVPFSMIHKRIIELMGRDVWTHELAFPDSLIDEIKSGAKASMDDIIKKFPSNKPLIVINASE